MTIRARLVRVALAAACLAGGATARAHAQGRLPFVTTGPAVGFDSTGFRVRSDDNRFQLRLRGFIQPEARFYLEDQPSVTNSEFVVRRGRIVFETHFTRYLAFRIQPEFGLGNLRIEDFFGDIYLTPQTVYARIGKLRTPHGWERAKPITDQPFPERSMAAQLTPNRDIGLQVSGAVAGGKLEYWGAVMNGAPDNINVDRDFNNAKDLVARVAFRSAGRGIWAPNQLVLGVSGTTGSQDGSVALPQLPIYTTSSTIPWFGYRFDGTAAGTAVAAGRRIRGSAFASFHHGRFGVEGEALHNRARVGLDLTAADLTQTAFSVMGDFSLTGEPSTPGGLVPRQEFDPDKGHWGAVMLAARVSQLAVDQDAFPVFADPTVSARRATAWGLAATWYVTRLTKAQLAYEETHFEGGAVSGDRPTIRLLELRLQFAL